MNKQEQNLGSAGAGLSTEMITETIAELSFTPEQLPGLWLQIIGPYHGRLPEGQRTALILGLGALYRRCDTYPQHVHITAVLAGMPSFGWDEHLRVSHLFQRATPTQLLQALACEQQVRGVRCLVFNHILSWASLKQLTGPVIEQLPWNSQVMAWASGPTALGLRCRHIVEHIQQHLLGGNANAWTVFCGIAETGTLIGEAAVLAAAIEQPSRP